MIGQEVNLYQDRFREKKLPFSAAHLFSMLLVLLILGGGASIMMQSNLDDAREENAAIKLSQQLITDELNAANAELATLLADKRMDQEISGLSREVKARRKILAFVSANQFGSGQGFSPYLLALSQLHVDNVWLNEILLAEDFVKILGSALDAERVPQYFGRFSEQEVFQGHRFNVFQLDRNADSDWKVDFEIATDETLYE